MSKSLKEELDALDAAQAVPFTGAQTAATTLVRVLVEPAQADARDAARWRYVVNNCEWRRSADADGRYSLLAVRLPYEADQSCVATRTAAIDAAIDAAQAKPAGGAHG